MNNRILPEDDELKRFFSEWKKKDEDLVIPHIDICQQHRLNPWKLFPFGMAAVLVIGFFLLKPSTMETGLEKDLIIIQLIEHANQEQEFIIETTSTLDVWEAPSSSLLTEF
ncbi:hypothetical protein [Mongoliitalea lutea]|uniref:Uncharacterized protein n=1 Tax=Mongoliitalea lutea TaxID=849756 RepID=A0A8J3CZ89_9BACT|nr:hypothetical protein [Mongoliitalea lutea]GHB38927.1 hypothetical protein GCM10008106_20170 [Mongoliitalea lutea]